MRKFLAFILISVLLIPPVTFAASAGTMLLTKPTVFLSGADEYNVLFATTDYAAAFVEISYGGKTYLFADEYDGLIRTDDYIHTVRVPKSLLDSAGGYTIVAREVASNSKSGISYESEMREKWTFYGDKGKDSINISFVSDLHLKPAEFGRAQMAKDIMDNKMGAVDLIVFNGDITDALPNDMYFAETLLEGSHIVSGGQIPVIYVRGNHEARGEFAQFIDRYLAFDGGNMYGRVEYGPASFIVGDCGEDKPDYQVEYGGLVDFDNYLVTQLEWLKNMGGYDSSKPYHVALSHSPRFFDRKYSSEAFLALENYGTDIQVSGHSHTAATFSGAKYPIVIDGGIMTEGFRAGLLKMSGDDIHFEVWDDKLNSVFTHSAKTVQKTVTPKPKEEIEYVENEPLTSIVTGSGILANKGSKYSPSVTVPPTVFDCGDSYNIVYVADAGSNLTKAVAEVTANDGRVYTFTDAKAGNAVSDSVHSIAVPKDILEGATYVIKTTYLGAYGAYGENYTYEGVSTDIGLTVTSKEYAFPDFTDDSAVTFASFSDRGGLSEAVKVKSTLSVEPDVIVLGGNMTSGLYTKNDFIERILVFANTLSGGVKPVIFTRGAGECYGDFSPYISQILRISQNGSHNGMYFATRYGDINVVVCDTNIDKVSKTYYQRQREWLASLTLTGGKNTFFVGADAKELKSLTAGSYDKLGGVGFLSEDGEYGKLYTFNKNAVAERINSFYGTKKATVNTVTAAIDQARLTQPAATPPYLTNEQKQLDISPDYEETVTDKPTDLGWHTLMLYEWAEYGLDTALTDEFEAKPTRCTEFFLMYFNMSGIDFDKLEYQNANRQLKALKLAYDMGLIMYEPPLLLMLSDTEITQIVAGGSVNA